MLVVELTEKVSSSSKLHFVPPAFYETCRTVTLKLNVWSNLRQHIETLHRKTN